MTERVLLSEFRERIGAPSPNDVSDRRLRSYSTSAMEWLAGEVGSNVRTDEFSLVINSSTNEYPLPSDLLSMVWMEWNGTRLEPASISERDRDQENWRTLTASSPTQYAIQGRSVILLPPPSASAVSTDSIISYRYIASATPIGPDGPHGLSEADSWVIVWRSAYEFCIANPSEENAARVAAYAPVVGELLLRSKQRWGAGSQTDFLTPQFKVDVGSRTGGAR